MELLFMDPVFKEAIEKRYFTIRGLRRLFCIQNL